VKYFFGIDKTLKFKRRTNMRKKMMLAVVLVTFLSSGIFSGFAMADTLEFTSPIYGTEWNAGRMNFVTTHNEFQWGYCIENGIWSNWSPVKYEYVLRPVTDYFSPNDRPLLGLIAADLILRAGLAVTDAEATALQHAIWDVQGNINGSYANYTFKYEASLLESYFDIAFVKNTDDGYGQDFIVWHPVPEPATIRTGVDKVPQNKPV
jgi:hypothetical protein